jgi:Mg2+ and Co2+ transporter CorA
MSTILTKEYPHFHYFEYQGLTDVLRKKLETEFHILGDDVEDVFSPTQLSKFEIRKNYAYFALQFADVDGNNRICIQQIHCLVSPKYLFVIDEDGFMGIKEFDKIRNRLVEKEHYNSFDLFYELLDISVIRMFKLLQSIQTRVRNIESTIFSDGHIENDQISEIQDTKKSVINFKSILSPLYDMFEELSLKHTDLIDETGKESIDDSLDKIKKLVNRLDNFREITKLLTETNEMIMARSTNQTVKRLTMFNVLLLVPSLTAAFFGMNVHFGWFSVLDDQLWPLLTIAGIMIILTIGIYSFFTWKKWI